MIECNRQKRESNEVILSTQQFIAVCQNDVSQFKALAGLNESGKFRFCSHRNLHENVHEMFIVHKKNTYVRPHKHINKSESMLILEGNAFYVSYDDIGNIKDAIEIGDYKSGKTFYISEREGLYHNIFILSEQIVFLEITNGPFKREDTVFASWSPEPHDENRCNQYMNNLEKCLYG